MTISLTLLCCFFLLGACVVVSNQHGKETTARMKLLLIILMSFSVGWCLFVLYTEPYTMLVISVDVIASVVGYRLLHVDWRQHENVS